MRVKLALFLLIMIALPVESKSILLNSDFIHDNHYSLSKARYIVKDHIDLNGSTLSFDENSIIVFKGGSLNNGIIKGTIILKSVSKGCLNIGMDNESRIISDLPVYSNDPKNDATVLSACTKRITLHESLTLDKEVFLRATELDGNHYSITSREVTQRAISRQDNDKDCHIHDLVLIKEYMPNTSNRNYALFFANSSNITIKNCDIEGRLYFVNNRKTDTPDMISKNVLISKCILSCNLSACSQGWELEQDHITIISYKDVTIESCLINSHDVTRVLKTTAYFSEDVFDYAINCTERVIFKGNTCHADCRLGKQFWDMFCGTVDACVTKNTVLAKGMTFFIEDKAVQPKIRQGEPIHGLTVISDNDITMDGGSLFSFSANSETDSYLVTNNTFTMEGVNSYPQTGFVRICGAILQGYDSCTISHNSFLFRGEACGLLFAVLNFEPRETIIADNHMSDVYRVNFTSSGGKLLHANSLVYSNNSKEYSGLYKKPTIELAFEGSTIKDVKVVSNSECISDYLVQMNDNAHINHLDLQGVNVKKIMEFISKSANFDSVVFPKRVVRKSSRYELE